MLSLAEKARRDKELEQYGRILSLRPSIEHTNKRGYTRKEKHRGKLWKED